MIYKLTVVTGSGTGGDGPDILTSGSINVGSNGSNGNKSRGRTLEEVDLRDGGDNRVVPSDGGIATGSVNCTGKRGTDGGSGTLGRDGGDGDSGNGGENGLHFYYLFLFREWKER